MCQNAKKMVDYPEARRRRQAGKCGRGPGEERCSTTKDYLVPSLETGRTRCGPGSKSK
jgi:hypothetical protein